jgi:hypothetical protein
MPALPSCTSVALVEEDAGAVGPLPPFGARGGNEVEVVVGELATEGIQGYGSGDGGR